MVGGYVDGLYKWTLADWARFPNSVKVRIAVFASTNDGHVLDVEQGDATPVQAPVWAKMRRAASVDPSVYCNRSNIAAIRAAFTAANEPEPHFWLATLDGSLPWTSDIVAIQYQGQAITLKHYDRSIVNDYWPGVDTVPPVVLPLLPVDSGSLLPIVNQPVTPPPVLPPQPTGPCDMIIRERDSALD